MSDRRDAASASPGHPGGPPDGFVQLGTLGRSFGLEGGLRVYPLGDAEAAALDALAAARGRLFVEALGAREVRELRPHGGDRLVFLAGVRNREAARELSNARLWADPAALPPAPEGRAYLDRLLGAPVVEPARSAAPIGRVEEVWAGAQDLLHVRLEGADGARGGRRMLPLQAPYVRFDGERVELHDPPEGLLEP